MRHLRQNGVVQADDLKKIVNKYDKRLKHIKEQPLSLRAYIYQHLKKSEFEISKEANISRTILHNLYNKKDYKLSDKTRDKLLKVLLKNKSEHERNLVFSVLDRQDI